MATAATGHPGMSGRCAPGSVAAASARGTDLVAVHVRGLVPQVGPQAVPIFLGQVGVAGDLQLPTGRDEGGVRVVRPDLGGGAGRTRAGGPRGGQDRGPEEEGAAATVARGDGAPPPVDRRLRLRGRGAQTVVARRCAVAAPGVAGEGGSSRRGARQENRPDHLM